MSLKILHTADWHLGKRLDDFSRLHEQQQVLQEICEIADQQEVDLVIIAGDLFDTFNPAVEAVELFYKTLKRLSNNGARPVIAIAGNHDSPERIDAPDPLARECGIILIGHPKAKIPLFEIQNKFKVTKSDAGFFELMLAQHNTPIRIVHTAYANEQRLKKALDFSDKNKALNEQLKLHWQEISEKYCDKIGVNLLVSHLYMVGVSGEELPEPDAEKPLKLGTADLIQSGIIPHQIQYTALGHLHRAHQIGSDTYPVVYSGSPLSYSFSEAGQKKYVVIVEASADTPVDFTKVSLEGGRPLSRMRFDTCDKAIEWLKQNPTHLVELTLISDTFLTAEQIKELYSAHDGIITLIPIVSSIEQSTDSSSSVNLEQDMAGLFSDYFKSKNKGQLPNQELFDLFQEVLNQ